MSIAQTVRTLCASTLLAVAANAQGMSPDVDLLAHRVLDAEYSEALDRLVMVATTPSDQLHVYDPVNRTSASIDLPLTPTCVSVAPDGLEAVVGHNGWVTHIDLSPLAIINTFTVPANVGDVVLAGNGFAYAFPQTGQWVRIECLELATGTVTQHVGNSVRQGTRVRLHPSGDWIYGADNGLSPSDIEKYDITAGTATYLYDSPYHGDFSMCGDLWLSEDGLRIFTRCTNVFLSSASPNDDMTFTGSLSQTTLLNFVAHSSDNGRILALPANDDTELQIYDDAFLAWQETVALPTADVGGNPFATHGEYVFQHSDSQRAFILCEVDPTSGLINNWGVATYEFEAVPAGLTAQVASLSVAAGGLQVLDLDAGLDHADRAYRVLGSLAGSSPGIPIGDVILPLNFEFRYFVATVAGTAPMLVGANGFLDGAGQAHAAFVLPAGLLGPQLVGLTLHHAVLVLDDSGAATWASNAVALTLDP